MQTGGEDNQIGSVGCVSLMTQHHTSYVVSSMTTWNANVQQRSNRVWYSQAHDSAERAVGFVSNNHGEGGGEGEEGRTKSAFGKVHTRTQGLLGV